MSSCHLRGRKPTKFRVGILAAVVAILVSFPFVPGYFQSIIILVVIYSFPITGLSLLAAHAGQISLGHAAFFGIGGYTSAVLAAKFGVSPWCGLLAGPVLSGTIAYLVGKPVLRLRGFALAVATGALTIIFHAAVSRWYFVGAHDGIGVPALRIGSLVFSGTSYFYLSVATLVIALLLIRNLINSQFGRLARSTDIFRGGSEIAAATCGVDVAKVKVQIFVIGCCLAGLGGSFYAFFMHHVEPHPFAPLQSVFLLLLAILGGVGSLFGGIIGAGTYIGIREMLTYFLGGGPAGAAWQIFVLAVILLLILVFLPGGLASLPDRLRFKKPLRLTKEE